MRHKEESHFPRSEQRGRRIDKSIPAPTMLRLKLLPTTIAHLFFVAIFSLSILDARESKPEKRRNPYKEPGSEFTFYKSGDPFKDWNPVRKWAAADGRKLKAKILEVRDGNSLFLLPGNKKMPIPISRFSEEDHHHR